MDRFAEPRASCHHTGHARSPSSPHEAMHAPQCAHGAPLQAAWSVNEQETPAVAGCDPSHVCLCTGLCLMATGCSGRSSAKAGQAHTQANHGYTTTVGARRSMAEDAGQSLRWRCWSEDVYRMDSCTGRIRVAATQIGAPARRRLSSHHVELEDLGGGVAAPAACLVPAPCRQRALAPPATRPGPPPPRPRSPASPGAPQAGPPALACGVALRTRHRICCLPRRWCAS